MHRIPQAYPNVYGDGPFNLIESAVTKGASTDSSTTPDIVHAITSKYPQTSYVSANFDGMPCSVVNRLLSIFPDRMIDALNTMTVADYATKGK